MVDNVQNRNGCINRLSWQTYRSSPIIEGLLSSELERLGKCEALFWLWFHENKPSVTTAGLGARSEPGTSRIRFRSALTRPWWCVSVWFRVGPQIYKHSQYVLSSNTDSEQDDRFLIMQHASLEDHICQFSERNNRHGRLLLLTDLGVCLPCDGRKRKWQQLIVSVFKQKLFLSTDSVTICSTPHYFSTQVCNPRKVISMVHRSEIAPSQYRITRRIFMYVFPHSRKV
jgi:hypothetical protein